MTTVDISSIPLSRVEKELYKLHLNELGLDPIIWDIYHQVLLIFSKYSRPCIVRIKEDEEQVGHFYMMKTSDYGAALSRSSVVRLLVRLFSIPTYTWIKASIGADTISNPGFMNRVSRKNLDSFTLVKKVKSKFFMLIIQDFKSEQEYYPGALCLPYSDLGNVDVSNYSVADEYLREHKNLKKKLRKYKLEGGRVDVKKGKLSEEEQDNVNRCILSTASKSIFTLPFQDIYPEMCLSASRIGNDRFLHFLCRSDDRFYGYHSFIQFENQIRCIHGAFNRELHTTFHAYENMIFEVIKYAISNRVEKIYFGPVLNETKRRMMNQFIPTQLYVYSRFPLLLRSIAPILKRTRMTSRRVRAFSSARR